MANCRCHSGQEMLFAKIIPVKFFIKNFSYYILISIFAATIKILTKNYQTMKKLFFSVYAASLLLFSACSKDDKDVSEMSSAEISSMIVGTWQFIQDEWIDQIEGGGKKAPVSISLRKEN